MAAHLLTGTLQILADSQAKSTSSLADQISPAVHFSCFSEDDTRVWTALYDFLDAAAEIKVMDRLDWEKIDAARDGLRNTLIDLLPDIIEQWQQYGRPTTREEWNRAKYPDLA